MGYKFDRSGKLKSVNDEEWDSARDDGSYVVLFDSGTTTDGKAFWLYIAVKTGKYKEFLRLTTRRATIRYADYGNILRYGFAQEVPEDIKQEMKKKYGNNEQYEQWLQHDIEKARQLFLKERTAKKDTRVSDIVAKLRQNNG